MTICDIRVLIRSNFLALDFFDFLVSAEAAKGSALKCAEILAPSGVGTSSYSFLLGTTSSRL